MKNFINNNSCYGLKLLSDNTNNIIDNTDNIIDNKREISTNNVLESYNELNNCFYNFILNSSIDNLEKLKLNLEFIELSKLFYKLYYKLPNEN